MFTWWTELERADYYVARSVVGPPSALIDAAAAYFAFCDRQPRAEFTASGASV